MLCPCHTPPPPRPESGSSSPPPVSVLVLFSFSLLLFVPLWVAGIRREPRKTCTRKVTEWSPPATVLGGGGVFPPRLLQQPEKQCGHLPCNAQEEAALEEAALEGARKDAAGSGSRNPSRLVVWGRNLNICRKPACGGLSGAHAALRRPSFHRDPAFWDATSLSVSAPAARPAIL